MRINVTIQVGRLSGCLNFLPKDIKKKFQRNLFFQWKSEKEWPIYNKASSILAFIYSFNYVGWYVTRSNFANFFDKLPLIISTELAVFENECYHSSRTIIGLFTSDVIISASNEFGLSLCLCFSASLVVWSIDEYRASCEFACVQLHSTPIISIGFAGQNGAGGEEAKNVGCFLSWLYALVALMFSLFLLFLYV